MATAIEKGVYNLLSTYVALNTATIRFGAVNQTDSVLMNGEIPYIVFYRTGTNAEDTKSGRSSLDVADITVNIFYSNASGCNELAEKVRGALDRRSGTFNGCVIQSIQYTSQSNLFEFNETYNNKGVYQISQNYSCRFEPNYQ
jgi:hypothetical protein